MRRPLSALLALVAGAALALFVLPAASAQAGVWGAYPTAYGTRSCSATRQYNGVSYQTCLDYTHDRTQVRAIAFINPTAYTNFQVNMRMWYGGGGASVSQSCPTMTTNGSRACWTGWSQMRRPCVVADATFGIAGHWMQPVRALDAKLSGKVQEESNYCGPAAMQTVIATMGISAPSQRTLADLSDAGVTGTWARDIPPALNKYVPQDFPYHVISVAQSGDGRRRGIGLIVDSVSRGRPVMAMVKPGNLPWSPDNPWYYRHYVVIHGVGGHFSGGSFVPTTFKVWDPNALNFAQERGREDQLSEAELMYAGEGTVVDDLWTIASWA
ncbi:C39 family peptidase [Actinomadura namibiensis]|uniref:Peptidase C39-like domain-containing protein n=1 Tax=Actinomadura namibiensis TaxID=182080 RepID=A0A7W3LXK5_ACTNM|nr:C39 family peptidase [Actinomadura namibiensis]MBA8956176.1 hypothetical protein [Actinomadura namibiensis]